MDSDPRFRYYGLAPAGKADYAFLLHNLYHTKPDGIVTIVLPHGVLFRGGDEEKIRTNLIEKNNIDTIIGLPANIFFGTGIPTIIMNPSKVPMAGFFEKGKYHKGIEDYVPETQFNSTIPGNERCEHPRFVVNDIINNWQIRSVDGKFHALFATNSIPEAINYYHLFKEANQDDLNVCVLFDPNDPDVDNPDKIMIKNEAMIEIIDDYNKKYKQSYSLAT